MNPQFDGTDPEDPDYSPAPKGCLGAINACILGVIFWVVIYTIYKLSQ